MRNEAERVCFIHVLGTDELLDLYERHVYEQWLRVYMRSKMIKHDKDIFEAVDDKMAVLDLIRLY